jgi:L-histidine N-alpha-methyltransferase
VTADFNKNLLQTLNVRLDADFELDAFDHVIVYDDVNSWIEMRLRARRRCRIRVGLLDWEVEFSPGEEIRTEVSAKYTREGFDREVGWAGLDVQEWLPDIEGRFALAVLAAT